MNKIYSPKIILLLILLSGCKYRASESRYGNDKRIYIEFVQNQSLAPQLGPLVAHKVSEHLLRRGHFEVTSDLQTADLVVQVSLLDYTKNSEIYNPKDTLLAAGFRLNINAVVSLFNRNGKLLIDKAIVNENASVLRKDSLTKPLDRQALLSLSESMGSQISQLIENSKW